MATTDLRSSFGALFVGCVISVSLSGMAALQAYLYARGSASRDSRWFKLMVLGLWLLDVSHTVFICQGIWHYLVLNWGNTSELDVLSWTIAFSISITALLTFVVHCFFATRVWRISKRKRVITILIVILAFIRLCSGITTTIQMLRLKRFSTFIKHFRWLFTLGLALTAFIDIIITSSLLYYLQSSRIVCSSLDDVIQKIIWYTVNNGLMTTFASIVAMICAAAMPHNLVFLSLHFVIAKCYMNSLLATLNSRDAIREHHDEQLPLPLVVSTDSKGNISNPPRLKRQTVSRTARRASTFSPKSPTFTLSGFSGAKHAERPGFDTVSVIVSVEQEIHSDPLPDYNFRSGALSPCPRSTSPCPTLALPPKSQKHYNETDKETERQREMEQGSDRDSEGAETVTGDLDEAPNVKGSV